MNEEMGKSEAVMGWMGQSMRGSRWQMMCRGSGTVRMKGYRKDSGRGRIIKGVSRSGWMDDESD